MIEGSRTPAVSRVTDRAIHREAGRLVIRIGRCVVVLRVARSAVRGSSGVLTSDVTLNALQVRVHARKREARVGSVIEFGSAPA